ERTHAEAMQKAERAVDDSQRKAHEIVSEAKTRADRIRSESDRELKALTQRRDSINAQLSNVRQMLATLSGTDPSALLGAAGLSGEQPAKKGS
ncbi:MAG: DivIVA domain-containing protein, partial [Actinopolymorphaceae bacterium]